MSPPSLSNGVQPNPRKRLRPAPSCQECRRRKVKCDRQDPCGHCVLSKKQCHYGPGSARASRISTGVHAHDDIPYATPPQASISTIGPSPASEASHLSEQLVSQPSQGIVNTTVNVDPESLAVGPRDERISLNKSRLFGKSHWTNLTLELQKTAAALNPEIGGATDNEALKRLKWEIGSLLQKCKHLSRRIKSSQSSRSCPQAYTSISKAIADQMAHLYITRFESVFRILHIPSFWIEYEKYWSDPTEAEIVLQLKVQLVIAIGSTIQQESRDVTDFYSTAARQWVHAAQEWLSGPTKKNRISISSLQVQCLLILARQVFTVGGDLIWISMGTLVRTAMQMGLHRDPKHFNRMGVLESEIRRRLWATILELDVQAALDAGMPPGLSSEDFDTEAPSNVNDEDIDEQTEVLRGHHQTATTDSSLQRFLLQSLPSRLEAVRRMNGMRSAPSEMSYKELTAITNSIVSTCRSCSAHIPRNNSSDIVSFQNNLADLLLRRFVLQLHRPLAARSRTDPTFYFSRKMSLDAAMSILSPLPKSDEFRNLALLGAGLFKHRLVHASLALASELLIDIEEQYPVEFQSPSQDLSAYRRMLMESLKDAIWQSAERIRLGEANAKLHMKLSMVMRQTEMAGRSSSSLQQVAESAKESLEISYALIQERARSAGIEAGGNDGLADDFDPEDFDPENFTLSSNFNLDDLFFIPAEFEMDSVVVPPHF